MPLSLSNCGLQGFYIALGCPTLHANSCGGMNLDHFGFMLGMLTFGLAAIFYFFCPQILRKKLFSLIDLIKKQFFIQAKFFANQGNLIGNLKPFDNLLLAYSSGIIQPKTF
jgi:hypothetical protein